MASPQDAVALSIESALSAIGSNWYNLLVALVGVGIVTMALLQLLKDLLPTRRWFQRWWLTRFWLQAHAAALGLGPPAAEEARRRLVDLATAGDEQALFSLPVEQLAGQLNAATQAVLDRPKEHAVLVRLLARRADPDDVELILRKRPTEPAALARFLEARNRVAQQIQRSLDAVQISMGYRWQWILQGLSVVLSAAIIFAGLTVYGGGLQFWRTDRIAYAFFVSVLGGFVAPVARDLVAAIQSLRGRAK